MSQNDPVILPVIFFGLILWLVLIFICIAYNIAIELVYDLGFGFLEDRTISAGKLLDCTDCKLAALTAAAKGVGK